VTTLGPRFKEALAFTADTHQDQLRKGPDEIPYIAHLMAVASIVLSDGGSEDEAIVALLHDAVEDHGGEPMAEEIERRFGAAVAGIVRECSDSITDDPQEKSDSLERKRAYVDQLRTASDAAITVSLADKVDNARAIVRDLEARGGEVWRRFNVSDPLLQVRYYYSLARRFQERQAGSLRARQLMELVERMRVLAEVSEEEAAAAL
jgi:(p)ppGpp synthase/HD superfamily hydrolase